MGRRSDAWPRARTHDAGPSSLSAALEELLRGREHRLWLNWGWFPRLGLLLVVALMLGLVLASVVRPIGDLEPAAARLLVFCTAGFVACAVAWREIACARLESEIHRLRLLLAAHAGDQPVASRRVSGMPRPWQRRVLLACEGIVVLTAVALAWRRPVVSPAAGREYMEGVMRAGDWADEIRRLDSSSQAHADDARPASEDVARYCELRQRLRPALRAMEEADRDLLVGATLAVLGDPDGKDMAEWQSAGARWEDARRTLLYEAHRALWREHLGPSRLRWMGEWIEWRTMGRPEAATFALRGADARRWFALRLRARALADLAPTTPEARARLERARTEATAEITRLEAIARSRSAAAPIIPLDACSPGSLERIDNIGWLAMLDAPESPWEEAAW